MRPKPQETADLVTFTEEIRNGKLHFLCCDYLLPTKKAIINEIMKNKSKEQLR